MKTSFQTIKSQHRKHRAVKSKAIKKERAKKKTAINCNNTYK